MNQIYGSCMWIRSALLTEYHPLGVDSCDKFMHVTIGGSRIFAWGGDKLRGVTKFWIFGAPMLPQNPPMHATTMHTAASEYIHTFEVSRKI